MNKREIASCLLIVAGSGIDALMILGFNVLTAAQTGNTILFAAALARGDAATGIGSAVSILAFLLGGFTGGFAGRRGLAHAALGIELVLIAAACGLWSVVSPAAGTPAAFAIVALAAAAMGLQSAVIIHIHGRPGTYVTGVLAAFAFALSGATRKDAAAHGLVWVLYLAGAVVTSVAFLHAGRVAFFIPLLALTAAFPLLWRLPPPSDDA